MRCYIIHNNKVTVLAEPPASIPDQSELIQSIKNLDQNRFPVSRLVELWNALPGAESIKRFRDRPTGLKKLWVAMEALPISNTRTDSKHSTLIALLSRPSGAGMGKLMKATGWQAHSVRGVLSGVMRKKLGLNVISAKDGNSRIYRIEA